MRSSSYALMLFVLLSASPLLAEEPAAKADTKQAEDRGNLVADLARAAELAAFGRGELNDITGLKDFKSPEALVAAGALLLRAQRLTGKLQSLEAEVTEEGGEKVAAEESPSFEAEAEELFDTARGMVKKENAAALEQLIKQAQAGGERGALGGPRAITRRIGSGKVHTLVIPFEAHQPATVTMRGTGVTQFEVLSQEGKKLWHSRGSWGTYSWNTGGGPFRVIRVKVINKGGPAVAYHVTTN